MERNCGRGVAEGKLGHSKRQDPSHVGWMDLVVHPDSPAGGGGPGGFSQSCSKGSKGISLPVGKTSDALHNMPMNTDQPKPPNAPPATQARSIKEMVKKDTEFWDVAIEATVLADGTSSGGVLTSHGKPAFTAPTYDTDGKGKITAFKGKFEWKGKIDIQTVYGGGATASGLTCYGRGTTPNDVLNRDITLGFHEHQHQQDFINYLTTHELPALPAMKIGMNAIDYDKEAERFKSKLAAYWQAMEVDTDAKTDEVGHRKSTWESDNTCYEHLLPEE